MGWITDDETAGKPIDSVVAFGGKRHLGQIFAGCDGVSTRPGIEGVGVSAISGSLFGDRVDQIEWRCPIFTNRLKSGGDDGFVALVRSPAWWRGIRQRQWDLLSSKW